MRRSPFHLAIAVLATTGTWALLASCTEIPNARQRAADASNRVPDDADATTVPSDASKDATVDIGPPPEEAGMDADATLLDGPPDVVLDAGSGGTEAGTDADISDGGPDVRDAGPGPCGVHLGAMGFEQPPAPALAYHVASAPLIGTATTPVVVGGVSRLAWVGACPGAGGIPRLYHSSYDGWAAIGGAPKDLCATATEVGIMAFGSAGTVPVRLVASPATDPLVYCAVYAPPGTPPAFPISAGRPICINVADGARNFDARDGWSIVTEKPSLTGAVRYVNASETTNEAVVLHYFSAPTLEMPRPAATAASAERSRVAFGFDGETPVAFAQDPTDPDFSWRITRFAVDAWTPSTTHTAPHALDVGESIFASTTQTFFATEGPLRASDKTRPKFVMMNEDSGVIEHGINGWLAAWQYGIGAMQIVPAPTSGAPEVVIGVRSPTNTGAVVVFSPSSAASYIARFPGFSRTFGLSFRAFDDPGNSWGRAYVAFPPDGDFPASPACGGLIFDVPINSTSL